MEILEAENTVTEIKDPFNWLTICLNIAEELTGEIKDRSVEFTKRKCKEKKRVKN